MLADVSTRCSDLADMSDKQRYLVAMSGGVDSSVCAALLSEQCCELTGVMLKLHGKFTDNDASCGTARDILDASAVAEKLTIPFSVYNAQERFEREVIERFVASYERGETPNPCIECNRYMKFGALFEYADELGCECIVTGHYARAEYDEKYGRKVLKKAKDESKDQSYVLSSLTKEQLERVYFPLGYYTKSEIREIAENLGLPTAHKKESQDICFVPDGKYVDFIERYRNHSYESGNFIDSDGNILGRHRGIIRYTVGQHKKLGIITPEPMYVDKILPDTNEILLVRDSELYKSEVKIKNTSWSAIDEVSSEFSAYAKLRYRHKPAPCKVIPNGAGRATLIFDETQRAPAKGQSAVIYDGDTVLGCGIIE